MVWQPFPGVDGYLYRLSLILVIHCRNVEIGTLTAVILLPLLPSLTHKNPQRHKIIHGTQRTIDRFEGFFFGRIPCWCDFCGCSLKMHFVVVFFCFKHGKLKIQSTPITQTPANSNCFSCPFRVRVTGVLLYNTTDYIFINSLCSCSKVFSVSSATT